MGLNCLLLTSDATLLEVIRAGFSTTKVELSARRHLDGFVIDCDGVERAMDLLAQIRGSRSNKLSVVLAVVNGTTSVSTAVDAGANFVLGKPVEAKMLHCILDLALPRMEREHRR